MAMSVFRHKVLQNYVITVMLHVGIAAVAAIITVVAVSDWQSCQKIWAITFAQKNVKWKSEKLRNVIVYVVGRGSFSSCVDCQVFVILPMLL